MITNDWLIKVKTIRKTYVRTKINYPVHWQTSTLSATLFNTFTLYTDLLLNYARNKCLVIPAYILKLVLNFTNQCNQCNHNMSSLVTVLMKFWNNLFRKVIWYLTLSIGIILRYIYNSVNILFSLCFSYIQYFKLGLC